jgi:hypothetical protein
MESGETVTVNMNITNTGHMNAGAGNLAIVLNFANATLSQDTFTLPALNVGANIPVSFQVVLGAGIADGTIIPIGLALTAGGQMVNTMLSIPVGMITEGFEPGNFGSFPWINNSAAPWIVASGAGNFHSGLYGAKSGDINDNGTTELSIALTVGAAGNISFWRKVSSESGYDFLKFYIDTVETASWSGTQDWAIQTYPVTAGQHTFKWSFSKDGSVSSGSDCGWIDDIVFPLSGNTSLPIFYTDVTEINFNNVPANHPVTQDFAIRNLGTVALTGTITIPADFELLENGVVVNAPFSYSLANAASKIYSLRIVPEVGMNINSTVTVTSNDAMNPATSIAVHLNTVANDDHSQIPVVTSLDGNYPNPFNPTTTIRFATKQSGKVQIGVYNTKGQLVRSLVSADLKAGYHTVSWNGLDDSGKKVSSGLYLYRMQADGFTKTNKMMLMK